MGQPENCCLFQEIREIATKSAEKMAAGGELNMFTFTG